MLTKKKLMRILKEAKMKPKFIRKIKPGVFAWAPSHNG